MKRDLTTKLKIMPMVALAAFLVPWLLVPSLAFAAGGGGGGGLDPGQYRVLILLAIIGVAYLITHLVLERIAERYGFVTGVEYIVLGAILGPVLGLLDTETVSALTPAIVLGTGSLGLYAGLHVDFDAFDELRMRALQSAVFIAMFTLITLVGVATLVLYYFASPQVVAETMPLLLCMGTVAMVADTGPLRAMAAFLGAEGLATDFGVQVAQYCSSIGIVAFGLIFCFYNTTDVPFAIDPRLVWLIWFGIHLLLGSVLGLVFATFLRRDFSDDKIITVVIGMVIFTSGFAYYLQLSPIFVNFILGVVLINIGRHADHVQSRLMSIKRPLYIVLFFFAGAALTLQAPLWGYALVLAYIGLRRVGRLMGSVAAVRALSLRSYGAGLSRALLAPGALSVAMLLNFDHVFSYLDHVDVLYNGLLTAIVLTEIFSYPMTRGWLIDVADVAPPEQRQASPSGDEVG